MSQKVLQIGSSAGITISKDALKALKLRIGSDVVTTFSDKLGIMVIKSAKNKTPINLELIAWTENFIDQYGDALRALAKK
jgi:putative addiction module antidote